MELFPTQKLLATFPGLVPRSRRPQLHRDLSWLQFNDRVLDEARQASGNPLLERTKFLAISSTNLDEFFMIRVASLNRSLRSHNRYKQLRRRIIQRLERTRTSILETISQFGKKQQEVLEILSEDLKLVGVHIVLNASKSEKISKLAEKIFHEQVFSKLPPPQTFASNTIGSMENLQMGVLCDTLWFSIPRSLPTIYFTFSAEGEIYFFFLDDLLLKFLGATLGTKHSPSILRLTRDADLQVDLEEDDPESIPDMVRSRLRTREKGVPVRLQYRGNFLLGSIPDHLKLLPSQIFLTPGTLCLSSLWAVWQQTPDIIASRQGLKYPTFHSVIPKAFRNGTLFEKIKERDYLLHHPYDSFDAFLEWIRVAANDPNVRLIEQTIYRVDASSPLIDTLKKAAAKKRIRVIIELRARFDEMNNLTLAEELLKSGVEVTYGFGRLKLHAKVALVTRKEENGETLYTHLSTGNYNSATARTYTDLAILTAHPEIGKDARYFFDCAFAGKVPQGFKQLLPAPARLHRKLLSLIHSETQAAESGKVTRIVAKVNALVDDSVIQALYRASQAGVQVDLIVRGACSLIPGIKNLSSNIRVISVVDRFLEHSRLYYFESQKAMYLSSADWMPRNFFSRLELAFPVLDPKIYSYIKTVLIPAYFSDNLKARELTQQGTWEKRSGNPQFPRVRSQFIFENLALDSYDGTPLHH